MDDFELTVDELKNWALVCTNIRTQFRKFAVQLAFSQANDLGKEDK